MKCVCIKDFFFPRTNSHDFIKGKIYVGTAIIYGAEFVNEGNVSHRIYGKLFDKHFIEIVELKNTKHNKASQGSEDSTQITTFVNWVASLSRTEYAAHEQLVAVINQAQKFAPVTKV